MSSINLFATGNDNVCDISFIRGDDFYIEIYMEDDEDPPALIDLSDLDIRAMIKRNPNQKTPSAEFTVTRLSATHFALSLTREVSATFPVYDEETDSNLLYVDIEFSKTGYRQTETKGTIKVLPEITSDYD